MEKKKMLLIGICVVIAIGGIWFFTRGGEAAEEGGYDIRAPRGVVLGETVVFHDEARLLRDEFSVYRIIGGTSAGDLAILFSEEELTGLREIVVLSECLTEASPFFSRPTDWDIFIFAAVDYRGYLYVLGMEEDEFRLLHVLREPPESLTLYVYNTAGELVESINWPALPDGIFPSDSGSVGYIFEETLVHVGIQGFAMLSLEGETLYFEDTRFSSVAVGGGHLYGLSSQGFMSYAVRKIEIPTGRVVWENSWFEETGPVDLTAFCEVNQRLYIFYLNRLSAYDVYAGQLHTLRELTNAGFRTARINLNASPSSLAVLGDGRLHLTFLYFEGQHFGRLIGYIEWIFTPLYDYAATERMAELAAQLADFPVIRIFDLLPGLAIQNYLLNFAGERNALVDISYIQTDPLVFDRGLIFTQYVETLNTAVFSGTASWDIVIIPSSFAQGNELPVSEFVERGLFIDFMAYTGGRFFDDTRFRTNILDLLKHDGGLYYLPLGISVPFVLVPDSHEEIDYLKERSQNWTWAEFLSIVQRIANETGTPPISANDVFDFLPNYVPNPISNVPPFFLFDEDLLHDLGRGAGFDDLVETLGLFAALSDARYNLSDGAEGVFTFACSRITGNFCCHAAITDSRVILPLPTMRGEYIFYLLGFGYAVMSTGESHELAIEFLVNYFEENNQNGFLSLIRESSATNESFEAVINRVNTYPTLPTSIKLAIYDAVVQYVHGALSRDAAANRVADIMWIFVNE
jgi:hypothetical protein